MATAAATSGLLGQHETTLNNPAGTDRVNADKNTFLKLLVAQLTHQDPLNPAEDKEFIAQLAQFTTVEELQNINKGIESLTDFHLKDTKLGAASLIGKCVNAGGDMTSLSQGKTSDGKEYTAMSEVTFELPRDTAELTVTISEANSDGTKSRPVWAANLNPEKAGKYSFSAWDGTDVNGKPVSLDRNYVVEFKAVDAEGKEMRVTTQTFGIVAKVETQVDGNHKLVLTDGRIVKFNEIEIFEDRLYFNMLANMGGGAGAGTGDGTGAGTGDGTTGSGTGGGTTTP